MSSNKLVFELMWWLFTLILVILAMLPIYGHLQMDYPFYLQNILFIVVAVTFIRYIFLLKHHWISSSKWIKVIFLFIPIPVFFYLTGAFYDFQSFSDDIGLNELFKDYPYLEQSWIIKYIKVETLFFFAAAFVANALLPFRMLISIWREINKGTH